MTTQEPTSSDVQLSRLATFLFSRRAVMLANWYATCTQDLALKVAAGLTYEDFTGQVPALLSELENRLTNPSNNTLPYRLAREQGRHRWHKGYALHELLHELAHLHQALLGELNVFWAKPESHHNAVLLAHQRIAAIVHEFIGGIVAQYDEFQRAEATERALNLQRALDNVKELGRKRGAMLRIASHDLRSSFSVIQGAASLLDMPDNTEQERSEMLQILNRNFPRLASMLTELMDLARLEAGRESINARPFDAAEVLRGLIESAQPLALERNLVLKGSGPTYLPVMGDATKVYRIAQNLLTNALKNTLEGEVSVTWSHESKFRWMLSVQDTGSGLPSVATMWLADHPRPDADSADETLAEKRASIATSQVRSVVGEGVQAGEGIGLYIVKRLCELLNASLDVETILGAGTLIRVRFPLHPAD